MRQQAPSVLLLQVPQVPMIVLEMIVVTRYLQTLQFTIHLHNHLSCGVGAGAGAGGSINNVHEGAYQVKLPMACRHTLKIDRSDMVIANGDVFATYEVC